MATDDIICVHSVNNHKMFTEFRNNQPPLNEVTRSLIDVKNNILYLFDRASGNILTTRSNSFVYETYPKSYQVCFLNLRLEVA